MSYRNERFNKGMRSLEAMTAEMKDVSKAKVFSDRGEGVERMVSAVDAMVPIASDEDGSPPSERDGDHRVHEEKLFEAEMRLVEADKRHLIRVLLLIVENGNDREASLEQVPRATYFRHRDDLLKFFISNQ